MCVSPRVRVHVLMHEMNKTGSCTEKPLLEAKNSPIIVHMMFSFLVLSCTTEALTELFKVKVKVESLCYELELPGLRDVPI